MRIKLNDTFKFGTTLNEVEVPDAMKKKIPSGLEYWDAALGGQGFTPGAVTLFTGGAGAGKTTTMLLLADSLARSGAAVVFNSGEESLYQLRMTSQRLGLLCHFVASNEIHVPTLLDNCTKMRNSAKYKDKPFFLYYPMMLTHSPYQPTPDSKTWDPKTTGEQAKQAAAHFGDMVEYMDKLVGKLVARLDALNLRENTLIVFVGDNGTGKGTRSMMGDKVVIGGKGTTTEFGMHVPLIASWRGKLAAGKVHADLVDSMDFLPTLLDAAGATAPANLTLDGRSFLPQMRGEKGQPREWIYSWYSPRQGADMSVRELAFNHRFKLYRTGDFYDIANDPEEKHPFKVSALTGQAAGAAKLLQAALDRFQEARPGGLDQPGAKADRQKRKKAQ